MPACSRLRSRARQGHATSGASCAPCPICGSGAAGGGRAEPFPGPGAVRAGLQADASLSPGGRCAQCRYRARDGTSSLAGSHGQFRESACGCGHRQQCRTRRQGSRRSVAGQSCCRTLAGAARDCITAGTRCPGRPAVSTCSSFAPGHPTNRTSRCSPQLKPCRMSTVWVTGNSRGREAAYGRPLPTNVVLLGFVPGRALLPVASPV